MYRIDHLVLTVRSIERTCQFYADALGVEAITFGDGRRALQMGDQKINLHEAGHEFEPKARLPTPGSGDFCVVTDEPLDELIARQEHLRVPIEEGPVTRTGAVGPLRSIYIRDPDGNLVEIANQT
jgi:catechol 2,3-dioxygenase-like lactoylglutathione lyase family enzyme